MTVSGGRVDQIVGAHRQQKLCGRGFGMDAACIDEIGGREYLSFGDGPPVVPVIGVGSLRTGVDFQITREGRLRLGDSYPGTDQLRGAVFPLLFFRVVVGTCCQQ